jgi:phosphoesterase RecJ-like protein
MVDFDSMDEFAVRFRREIDARKKFLILTHVRPDGDAYGCQLGMAHVLKSMGKEVVLWSEDPVAERYAFLPGIDFVLSGNPPPDRCDLRMVLDTANRERVGRIGLPEDPESPIVNIDHHVSNSKYGDLTFIDAKSSSCGEILFKLFERAQLKVNSDAAKCLFVAMSTDTGSFQYPSVTPETFRVAAKLLERGLDLGELTRLTFESYPARRLLLLREVLRSVKFDSNDQIGYFWLDRASYHQSGALPDDAEGLIDHIRSVKSVKVAVLLEEQLSHPDQFRISLRSKDKNIDVNKVAAQFGGGGHPAASGARLEGKREEVERKVLDAVRKELSR